MSKRDETDEMDVDEEEDEQTPGLVDVNFDYYNVNATNDYQAIHRLFIQLFGPDAERVQTGPLTDLVIRVAEESGVGSTIKTEEEEGSDPYAVLTVISCRDHAGLQGLIDYVLSKTSADRGFHDTLSSVLQSQHVGLVLSERLINMPVQVMGPMYTMLSDEMDDAIADGQGYQFTHFLFISRATFHPEDKEIRQHAIHSVNYPLAEHVEGHVMLVPGGEFKKIVKKINETYPC